MIEDSGWETREKVIAIIERHLSQDAKIERDVRLPVLYSLSDKRQCDIVISDGEEPRQTISIVEVQKRRTKPSVADFDGWYQKMRDVGAQHLICVSEKGFPKSVDNKVDRIGPTVRLLTFRQLEKSGWPIPSSFFSENLENVRYEKLNGIQMEYQHLVRVNKIQLPNPFDKIFRINAEKLVSINDMMDWHLFRIPKNLSELPRNQLITLTVNFKPNFGELEFLTPESSWVMLKKLIIQIGLIIQEEMITWESATYEQKGWGEIGWVLKGNAVIDGKKIEIVIPLKKTIPGEYVMGRPITLSNYDTFVSLGEKGFKSEQFKDKST